MNLHKRLKYFDIMNIIQRVTIVSLSIFLVLFMTLYPLNFSSQPGFSLKYLFNYFQLSSNSLDIFVNIILFVPFGFSLTYSLSRTNLKVINKLIIILLASFSLSLTVETLQIFLPSRTSSISDLVSNSLGGDLGFLSFYVLNLIVLNPFYNVLSIKVLTVCFIGYTIVIFLLSMPLSVVSSLDNWNSDFPLLLGNETTENRPWKGSISNLYITNKAIPQAEVLQVLLGNFSRFQENFRHSLIASYEFNNQENSYRDKTGHLPNLSWQGKFKKSQEGSQVVITPNHWLTTQIPANSLTQKIRETSEFTLITKVATLNKDQTGPARIISLSGDPYQRNFTIGQENSNLIFRLRTPITGENGNKPELIIHGIFADTKTHHLVITYAKSLLQIYIDKIDNYYALEITPIATILSSIFPPKAYELKLLSRFLYYGVVFIPLGGLLGLIQIIWRGRFLLQILLLCQGLFLPVLLLEIILATGSNRNIRLENILISLAIMSLTMFITILGVRCLQKKNLIFNRIPLNQILIFLSLISWGITACTPSLPPSPSTSVNLNWTHFSSQKGEIPPSGRSKQQTANLVLDVDSNGVNDFVIGSQKRGFYPKFPMNIMTGLNW